MRKLPAVSVDMDGRGSDIMLILAVCGSPNKQGNTAYMLNLALEEAKRLGADVKMIDASEALGTCDTPFCTSCSKPCRGICLEGTAMADAADLLRKADGVIFGTPVYFGTMSAQMKAFFDKIRCLRGENALLNTVGGALAVGHTQYGGEEAAMAAIKDAMMVYGMTVVGNGHADFNSGHLGVALTDPARDNKDAQEKMIAMTRRIVEVAKATAPLRKR